MSRMIRLRVMMIISYLALLFAYYVKKKHRGSYAYFAESGNCLFSSSTNWVIDSGASDHMTGNSHIFNNFDIHASLSHVTIANGSISQVLGSCTVNLSPSILLSLVLSLLKFLFNLLPVSIITSNLQCSFKFYPEYCVFKDLETKNIIGRGRKCDCLYVFEQEVSKSLVGFSLSSPFEEHCRLGHPSLQSLKKLCPGYSHLSSLNYDSCEFAKHKCVHLSPRANKPAQNRVTKRKNYHLLKDTQPNITKLDHKSLKCVFLGYSRIQKGYRCYSPQLHRKELSILRGRKSVPGMSSSERENGKKEAYDGEINLEVEENMISNEYAVKLCLEHEVKRGNKVVKKELIVALRGEIYFVKFIINPEEDDVKRRVIFGRSCLCMTKAITDFGARTITIYPDIDPFLEETEGEEKSNDDWDRLLDFNIKDVPLFSEEGLLPFVNIFISWRSFNQEEAAKEAIAIKMRRMFALLEEERPIIETMAYHDKYKKILDEVWKYKVELDGKIVNENTLADTGSDINTMHYRIYETLGREDMKKVDRGITMINHTQAEAMGSSQTFFVRFDIMRNTKSDSDDEEDYLIKRNKFGALIYGLKPAPYLNCNYQDERSLALQTTQGTHDDEARSSRSKRPRQHETVEEVLLPQVHHEFFLCERCNRDVKSRIGCDEEIDDMLRIRLREAGSDEEIFTFVAWIRAFNINETIYAELCHKFCSTYEFDKVCADDELLGLYQAVELEEEGFSVYFEEGLHSDEHFNVQDYWLSISREEDLGLSRSYTQNNYLWFVSKDDWDLYDKMGRMEIHQEVIERMEYKQSYHRDKCQEVFEHIAKVYSVPLQGAYNPPGYAQPQYDQYYQQYPPPPS
nr:Gag-Pol polyprotein [Tanacetum cinerariifolium]